MTNVTKIFFNSTDGKVEGKYFCINPEAPSVLILHAHPEYGGDYAGHMDSEIVSELHKVFIQNGFTTLRINFRKAGKSERAIESNSRELLDASIAMDWMQTQNLISKHWIVGPSWSAHIAAQITMRRPGLDRCVLISPILKKQNFDFLSPCPTSCFIVRGTLDSVTSEDEVLEFINKVMKQKNVRIDYRTVQNADHFFRNRVQALGKVVDEYIKGEMSHSNKDDNIQKSKILLD